jgi:ubiquinone/menaquinone biosynthesis C-methylase UbiE
MSRERLRDAVESIQRGPEGGRDLRQYVLQLGIDEGDLVGKRLLDLGAGSELKFTKEMKHQHPEVTVVSFSPAFMEEGARKRAEAGVVENVVAGLADHLPFASEVFERVVSLHMVEHLDSQEEIVKALKEIIRVLAPHGRAYVGPFYDSPVYANQVVPTEELQSTLGNSIKVSWIDPRPPHDWMNLHDGTGYKVETSVQTLVLEKS